MKTLLQLSQGHNIAVSVLQNLEPEERLSVSSFIQNDFQTSIFLINHVSPIKSTLCRMSSDIILPFVKSTTLILVQTVTAGAWHLVTKYKLSSQVLGSLLAGFWLLLLLLNPRPTSGWKQTKKYQHESCVFLVHCFHNVDKSFAGVVLAVGWIGRASWTLLPWGEVFWLSSVLFINNLVFLVFVLIRCSQKASPPPLYVSQKVVGKIFRVSPQDEHSIGLPTRHPHVRVCPNNR